MTGIDDNPYLNQLEEEKALKTARMNKFLQEQKNRFELLADYFFYMLDVDVDKIYDNDLDERYVRALKEDLYSCNEKDLWEYLSDNYKDFIKE